MADIVDSSGTRYARLNDQNYAEWSMRTEAVLVRRGLWTGIVHVTLSASEKETTSGTTTTTKTEEQLAATLKAKLDARPADKLADARAELILRVDSGQLSYMHDEDPREIWRTLKQVHLARGFATTLALKRAFLTGKKAPGQSMQAWIGHVSAHVFRMVQAGITVSELDRILAITMGLPPSYTPVIIHFDSMPPSELTINGVITRLLNEETRQNADANRPPDAPAEVADTQPDEAMAVVRIRGKSAKSSAPSASADHITCFLCQEHGHYMANCPLRAAFAAFIKKTMPGVAAAAYESDDDVAFSAELVDEF